MNGSTPVKMVVKLTSFTTDLMTKTFMPTGGWIRPSSTVMTMMTPNQIGSKPRCMIVFVIKSVVKDVSFSTIFKGVIPFVATDLVRLVILIAFPLLATWLPTRMMAH